MNSNVNHNLAFLPIIAIITILAAGALAMSWPNLERAAKQESIRLNRDAQSAPPAEAASLLLLATKLNPTDAAAFTSVAKLNLEAGRPDRALTALSRSQQGSTTTNLTVRALIELNRNAEAADQASALINANPTEDNLLLAGIAFALASRSADVQSLSPHLSSIEAAQSLRRIQAGNLALASELAARGLPKSSKSLLLKQPTSFTRNILLARLYYASHTLADLAAGTDCLIVAIELNPSDTNAHRLLGRFYQDQGQITQYRQQNELVSRLESSNP